MNGYLCVDEWVNEIIVCKFSDMNGHLCVDDDMWSSHIHIPKIIDCKIAPNVVRVVRLMSLSLRVIFAPSTYEKSEKWHRP